MFFFPSRILGLVSGLLLALLASTGTDTAWAQTTNENPSAPPVRVTLQVPTLPTTTSTTIQLQIRTDIHTQQTAMQVTSDANPSTPTIIAASVGSDSVATVRVDASDAFVWSVSPNQTRPGCGPHPPVGTPGCSHADTTTAIPQPGNVGLAPAALSAASAGRSVEVAGAQTTGAPVPGPGPSAPSAPAPGTSDLSAAPQSAEAPPIASAPVLQYTVQPGDTLAAVARHFYGDTEAVDRIVQTNLGQAMPDGRTFADSNQIRPGWVLALPQPTQVVYDRDGQCWYIVQPGDTLSTIAARLLGDAGRWPEVYALNSDRLEAPARIRVGVELELPVSQPGIAPAQPGEDDGSVQTDHPQPDATAPQQQAAGVPPTSASGTTLTPDWASPPRYNRESAAAGTTTPAGSRAVGPRQNADAAPNFTDTDAPPQLESKARSDRGTPALAAETQEILLPTDDPQLPFPAAMAALPTLLVSIALGLWFIRRVSRAGLQPRRLRLAESSPEHAFPAAGPPVSRPRTHSDAPAETDVRACRRARVLQAVLEGTLANEDAAAQLEVSTRQLRRLLAAYRSGGLDALRHANAGRVPAHAVPDHVRSQVVELVRRHYAGMSQSELAQRLATEHGIHLHRTTVRRILMAAGSETTTGSAETQAGCDAEPRRESAKRAVDVVGQSIGALR